MLVKFLRLIVILVGCLAASHSVAQPILLGDWLAKYPTLDFRLVLTLNKVSIKGHHTSYSGTLASANQGGVPIAIQSCTVSKDSVYIVFGGNNAIYNARIISGDTEELRGKYTLGTSSVDLVFRKAEKYEGTIDLGTTKRPMVFKIARSPEGMLLATMVSPSQSPNEIPANEVMYIGGHLSLDFAHVQAGYDGVFSEDHKVLDGTFKQGKDYPLLLERTTQQVNWHPVSSKRSGRALRLKK